MSRAPGVGERAGGREAGAPGVAFRSWDPGQCGARGRAARAAELPGKFQSFFPSPLATTRTGPRRPG